MRKGPKINIDCLGLLLPWSVGVYRVAESAALKGLSWVKRYNPLSDVSVSTAWGHLFT